MLKTSPPSLSPSRPPKHTQKKHSPLQIRPREQHQLPVHKVRVAYLRLRLVEEGARLDRGEPGLALLDLLLGEGELERAAVLVVVAPDEPLAVAVDAGEVGLGLLLGRGTETLRVFVFCFGFPSEFFFDRSPSPTLFSHFSFLSVQKKKKSKIKTHLCST